MTEAVIFDLDGVLLDSEHVWNEAREQLASERGGRWHERAQRDMMGMSSLEWSRYMHDVIGLADPPGWISTEVVRRVETIYRDRLPLTEGAEEAVARLAERFRLGLASSSNRPIIDLFLDLSRLGGCFPATVSSEEVTHGKPSPDVYLEVARRLGAPPERCVAIEDSGPGITSADGAGLAVVAVPNAEFPPDPTALTAARLVLDSLEDLDPAAVERAAERRHEGSCG